MNKQINYYDFLNKLNVLHSDANNSTDSLKLLVESKADAVTHNGVDKLLLSDIGVLHIDDVGNYFYEHTIVRNSDIISNINVTSSRELGIKLTYYIGGIEYKYEEINEFILVCADMNEFIIRITFAERPAINDDLTISSKWYFIKSEFRDLLRNNTVVTNSNVYRDGYVSKRALDELLCKKKNNINYYDFLNGLTVVHSDAANNLSDGIKFINDNNADAITYNYADRLSLFNVDTLPVDKDGNHYYNYFLNRQGNIMSDINFTSSKKLDIKLTYYIGGMEYKYDDIKELLFVCAIYHEILLRITFLEEPTADDVFTFTSKMYLLQPRHTDKLVHNMVATNSNVYFHGMCGRS